MDENEMKHRTQGFMIATGLLLEHADQPVSDGILKILKSFGEGLRVQIENERYAETASNAEINPCPRGYIWDPLVGGCVPE